MAIYKNVEPLEIVIYQGGNEDFDRGAKFILEKLDALPTADVVEVVRCCNCIHYKTNINKENYCDVHSTRWDKFYVRDDDYCSYGEKRKTD